MGAHEKSVIAMAAPLHTAREWHYEVRHPYLGASLKHLRNKRANENNIQVSFFFGGLYPNTVLNKKHIYGIFSDLLFCVILYRALNGMIYKLSGFAICNSCDPWEDTIGMRVALTDALRHTKNSTFKKAVWDGFVDHIIKGA